MKPLINWQPNIRQRLKNIAYKSKFADAKMKNEEFEYLKTAFFSNITHEMRTPLNSILGFAQLILNSEEINPNVQNDVNLIIESSNHLLKILNNIIDKTKLDVEQIKLANSSQCLNSLMHRIYNLFQENPVYIHKKSNIVLINENPLTNYEIMCDTERLLQIMVNLIDNALKFTEKGIVKFGYTIQINALSHNQYITFYVKDTGIGIPKDKIENIFEPFVKLNSKMPKRNSGIGLGLPVSKKLVDLMNGKMWCKSEVGTGTSFYFSVPYKPAYVSHNCWGDWENESNKNDQDIPEKIIKNNEWVCDWSDYTTLIVEDDLLSFKVLESMLRKTKVNIIHSDNGLKAIEHVRKNPKINLVLMDINLPEMNGWKATEKILEINPTLPVIAQTALEKEQCVDSGCIDYIRKPVDMGVLFHKMSRFLL